MLHELAQNSANAPEPSGTGRYHYVHTSGLHLNVRWSLSRSGERTLISAAVEPSERRQWIAADGSGRILETCHDQVLVPPSDDYGPGRLPAFGLTATNEAALDTALGRLGANGTTSGFLKAFRQIWNLQVVTPALQRVLLLRLASHEDLETEATGQKSIAVTHTDHVRHRRKVLTFNEETGELLQAEETALEGAKVEIPVPAVTSRTTWLRTGYRETTATPPEER